MSKKNKEQAATPKTGLVFNRDNYKWMLIGSAIIIIGYLLMIGKTDDLFVGRTQFEEGISFATHIKITLAPLLVLGGFGVLVYAIMKRPSAASDESN